MQAVIDVIGVSKDLIDTIKTKAHHEDNRPIIQVSSSKSSSSSINYTEEEKAMTRFIVDLCGIMNCVAIICTDFTLGYPGEMACPPIQMTFGAITVKSYSNDTLLVWEHKISKVKALGFISMRFPTNFSMIHSPTSNECVTRKTGRGWSVSWKTEDYNDGGDFLCSILNITTTQTIYGQTKVIKNSKSFYEIHTLDPLCHVIYTELKLCLFQLTGRNQSSYTINDSFPYLTCNCNSHQLFEISPGRFIQPTIDPKTKEEDFYDCRIQYLEGTNTCNLVKKKLKQPFMTNGSVGSLEEKNQTNCLRIEGWMRCGDMLVKPISSWSVIDGILSNEPPTAVIVWFNDESWFFERFDLPIDTKTFQDQIVYFDIPEYLVCNDWLVVTLPIYRLVYRFSLDARILKQRAKRNSTVIEETSV